MNPYAKTLLRQEICECCCCYCVCVVGGADCGAVKQERIKAKGAKKPKRPQGGWGGVFEGVVFAVRKCIYGYA